jgi:tubulin monoglycylase TTLL3/8
MSPALLRGEEPGAPRPEIVTECREVLQRLSAGDAQWHVRGDRGAWIIKPIGKSRGRGIEVFQSLEDIAAYVDGTQERYVAQKYIERPMLVAGRKFDFRLWVLVTAWNPIIAYKFGYYVRWCNGGYSLDSLADRTMHLANQAVQKHDENYGSDLQFGDNLWDQATMRDYLDREHGAGTADRIEDRMSELVLHTLAAAEHDITDHRASFELLGYDLMLDDRLEMWLIEVNETPSMDTGPAVLAEYVPNAVADMVGFALDAPTRRTPQTDRAVTGGWQLITDPLARRAPNRVRHGVDLLCVGAKKQVHKVRVLPAGA